MSNIKYRPMEQLSSWMEYKLKTDQLDPPVFRCRLRPLTGLHLSDGLRVSDVEFKMGRATFEMALEAVAEWDLAAEGVPIPLTATNKMGYLTPIIAEQVEGEKLGMFLGTVILRDALTRENFLKNSPASSSGGPA